MKCSPSRKMSFQSAADESERERIGGQRHRFARTGARCSEQRAQHEDPGQDRAGERGVDDREQQS